MRRVMKSLGIAAVITISGILYVGLQIESLTTSYAIRENRHEIVRLDDLVEKTSAKVMNLKAPSRLEHRIGEGEMPLIIPNEVRIIALPEIAPMLKAERIETGNSLLSLVPLIHEAYASITATEVE